MAKIVVKIEKEDVKFMKMGYNFIIKSNGIDVIFDPESLEELMNEYKIIKESVEN